LPIAPVTVKILPILGELIMDSYIYAIVALLPLTASMVVLQVNPYHALVIRGILGAIAALVYAVLGAVDVALTEALVGTLLAITLYAVAVRSSLVFRLGAIEDKESKEDKIEIDLSQTSHFKQIINDLKNIFSKRYMQVEVIYYQNKEDLHRALITKEVHAICIPIDSTDRDVVENRPTHSHNTKTRLRRLYDIMKAELASTPTLLTYLNPSNSMEVN
jgi:putative multicomponent Na+:H+ antiporter subunit B